MQSCLGLYIENNLIKYAKISKDKDNFRIESFGMKFYDNIDETIKQIISETYSFKTPIAVNLSDEKYTYAQLFSLLKKKDLQKAVETEFDYFCNETNKNRKAIEYRNLLVPNLEDKDRITGLYAYTDKSDIVRKLQILDSYVVKNVVPLPIAIANLSTFTNKRNSVIINIEKNTSVTTVVNGQIQRIDTIDNGTGEILDSIMLKENSYDKAYEICKNTTIYTTQGRNLQIEENEYLEDIMPVLYKIVEKVKDIIDRNGIQISNVYITGLAAVINNIDLYFQENFPDKECEILTPFFIKKTNVKLNIKDYIEVNSAVALALQGVGLGPKEINFKRSASFEKISELLKTDIGGKKQDKGSKNSIEKVNPLDSIKNLFKSSGGSTGLDRGEMALARSAVGVLLILIIYIIFSSSIIKNINKKDEEFLTYITDTQNKIGELESNTKLVTDRTNQYKDLIAKIEEASSKLTESYARKNALPNLLTQIMYNIPKEVQLISIQNTSGKTIKIEAKSVEYEQLGYFIAKIKNEGILINVTSTSGLKQDEYVNVTINGELPY
ncbi:MAG: hypothetical protein J5507_01280 [Clostridia bacterium]|nr:hypothetical protein [Clostridia bacterium]